MLITLLFTAACTAVSPEPTNTATAMPVAAVLETATIASLPTDNPSATATETTLATATTAATETPLPTDTATATATTLPTATPTVTPTAAPTQTPRPLPTATPAEIILPIGELQPGPADQRVTVIGRVTAVESFSRGYKFILDDGSGQVVLLMWDNVYDDSWDAPQLNLGATVRATGRVGEFDGELQIEPSFGGHVKVTSPAAPRPPQREIGSLGDHVGERVTITGHIARVEGGAQGTTLFVTNDIDDIAVFVWNNTLQRIPNNQALGTPGTAVRVVGVVSIFRNNRQIVPVLPYDVEVLP